MAHIKVTHDGIEYDQVSESRGANFYYKANLWVKIEWTHDGSYEVYDYEDNRTECKRYLANGKIYEVITTIRYMSEFEEMTEKVKIMT